MSLTKDVLDIYKRGHIRDSVMEHAIKEASSVRADNEAIAKADLINKRAEIFGAITHDMAKLAFFKWPFGEVQKIKDKKDLGATMGMRMGPVAKLMTGAMVLSALSDLAKKYTMGKKHDVSYAQMLVDNPELAARPDVSRKHFDIMKQFAPDLAANPTIAAGHVRQAIEMGNVIPADTIKNLAQAQKTYNEASASSGVASQVVGGLAGGVGTLLAKAQDLDILG